MWTYLVMLLAQPCLMRTVKVIKPVQLLDKGPAKLSRMLQLLSFCPSLLGLDLFVIPGDSVPYDSFCLFLINLCMNHFLGKS